MRVVLDANVLVSAAIRTGPSHRVVQTWLEIGDFEVVLCPRLVDEVRDVLTLRPRLRRWIDAATAEAFIATLEVAATMVPDPDSVIALTRDRDDDYIIALARQHGADCIVTGDKDLLEWAEQAPPVLAPAAFEEHIGDERDRRR